VELYNTTGAKLLSSDKKIAGLPAGPDFLVQKNTKDIKEEVGKLYVIGAKMYFPIIVSVSEREQRIGYLVKWRRLITSPQELEGFSKLIGEKGRLYIGNDDNTVWTDGLKTIPAPPISLGNIQKVITYTGPEGSDVIASAIRTGDAMDNSYCTLKTNRYKNH